MSSSILPLMPIAVVIVIGIVFLCWVFVRLCRDGRDHDHSRKMSAPAGRSRPSGVQSQAPRYDGPRLPEEPAGSAAGFSGRRG